MVSVCMATYNGEKYISKQIESILPQLSSEDEIIISDNDSTDNTLNIIEKINDNRIKIFILKQKNIKSHWSKFYNITANFENAINHSSGDIIIFCDQDDIWKENKINILRLALNKKDCVFSNYSIINENDEIIFSKKHIVNPLNKPIKVLFFPPFLGCTIGIKRNFLKYFLPFHRKLILHDIYIGLLAYFTNRIYFIDDVLTFYRCHRENITTASHGKTKNNLFWIISWRLEFYYIIILALFRYIWKTGKKSYKNK